MKSDEFVVNINGEDVTLCFKRPNLAELSLIDKEYRKIYSIALREGDCMTDAEARKKFSESGVWTREDENGISNFALQIARFELQLEDAKVSLDEKKKIAEQLRGMRLNYNRLVQSKTELFNFTVEGMANEQKMHKFIELCCVKPDGERFFSGREAYENFVSSNADELADIYRRALLFEYNLPEDITAEWGENKFLKGLKESEKSEQSEENKEVKTKRGRKPKTKEKVVTK